MKKFLFLILLPGFASAQVLNITGTYNSTQTWLPIPTAQATLVPAITPGEARAMTLSKFGTRYLKEWTSS